MGAVAYVVTLPALAHNRLNLGAYHGDQELIYQAPVILKELDCDFEVADRAALTVEFNRTDRGYAGVRFSRSDVLESVFFIASPEGAFTTKVALGPAILRAGWNHLHLSLADGQVNVWLNGDFIISQPLDAASPQQIGFRGSSEPSAVDNVRIVGRSETVVETFRNTRNYWPIFLAILAVLSLATVVGRRPAAVVTVSMLTLAVIAGGIVILSHLYLSERYPGLGSIDFRGYRTTIETKDEVVQRLARQYPRDAGGAIRILFLGTSQTWGAGASQTIDAYPEQIEGRLNAEAGARYQCINAGISGVKSDVVASFYESDWILLAPKLVVVDLSNNDGKQAVTFRRNLVKIAELGRSHGIKTLFVLESNSAERSPGRLPLHDVMVDVAREAGLPVVDLHGYINQHLNDGFLFWDFVHLTSFGHRIAADALYPAVRRELNLDGSEGAPKSRPSGITLPDTQ